jgi:hypothetical protein
MSLIVIAALASFAGCQPAPGWEKMTQLRLENIVEHIRLAREFHAKGVLSDQDKSKIEHDLGQYIVCTGRPS